MDKQNLIFFNFTPLYLILKELENELHYNIFQENNQRLLSQKLNSINNYLIISSKKIHGFNNQLIISNYPLKLSKLIEKINIELIRSQFNKKSELIIGKYKIDFNSRHLVKNYKILKLTEKELNIIDYLSKSRSPIGVDELQTKVWGYHSRLETHTVETHIYRLRKKIMKSFNDDKFILSTKNGYEIK